MPCGHAAHTKHYKNLLKERKKCHLVSQKAIAIVLTASAWDFETFAVSLDVALSHSFTRSCYNVQLWLLGMYISVIYDFKNRNREIIYNERSIKSFIVSASRSRSEGGGGGEIDGGRFEHRMPFWLCAPTQALFFTFWIDNKPRETFFIFCSFWDTTKKLSCFKSRFISRSLEAIGTRMSTLLVYNSLLP